MCATECREPICHAHRLPCCKGHIPLTPWAARCAVLYYLKGVIQTNIKTQETRLAFRVTKKQKQQIDDAARKCGLRQSEYLRQRALGYAPKAVLPDAFFVCCERLDRMCRKPFSREVNEAALAVLKEMNMILTKGGEADPWPPPDSGP